MTDIWAELASRDRRLNDLVGSMNVVGQLAETLSDTSEQAGGHARLAWLAGFVTALQLAYVDPESARDLYELMHAQDGLGMAMSAMEHPEWIDGLRR